uniref:Uncharacterized protein n=1 Tax=Anguilla anguilla TaxID=7936 RepID=A0A0E9SUU1_ANGAN
MFLLQTQDHSKAKNAT